MKCQNCGTKLPYDASYCDACGAYCGSYDERQEIKKKYNRIAAIIYVILALAGFYMLIVTSRVGELKPELCDLTIYGDASVSEEELSKIEFGMTYDEICLLTGDEESIPLWNNESTSYSLMYKWGGMGAYPNRKYAPEAYLCAEFTTDDKRLIWYDSKNIIEEDKIIDFYNTVQDDPSKLDTPIVTRKQVDQVREFMTYSQVSALFGGDGVITETYCNPFNEKRYDSETDIYRMDDYRVTYAWRCNRRFLLHTYPSYIEIEFYKGGWRGTFEDEATAQMTWTIKKNDIQ